LNTHFLSISSLFYQALILDRLNFISVETSLSIYCISLAVGSFERVRFGLVGQKAVEIIKNHNQSNVRNTTWKPIVYYRE